MIDSRAFTLEVEGNERFLPEGSLAVLEPEIAAVVDDLRHRRGPGAEFLGWWDLPQRMAGAEAARIREDAAEAAADCDDLVVVGIGGSYLGARAVLTALGRRPGAPRVLFAGTDLSAASLARLQEEIRDRDLRLCVISKSGTTLEPAVAFRFLRREMEQRYGRDNAALRITAITDAEHGVLRQMAEREGYRTFTIPRDVGGRFSVLTPVGLWPLAVAGLDVDRLLEGAADMAAACDNDTLTANPAHLYAAARTALYRAGFRTEILASFDPRLADLQRWWQQLFGESEGKEGRGIFPATATFTTDLHSLGQYIQQGRRDLMETLLQVEETAPEVTVPVEAGPDGTDQDRDGLAWLAGRPLDEINARACEGVRRAHRDGGTPVLLLRLQRLDEWSVGALLYFFERAVAVSARLLDVNPFDQPGVEAYKREMFRLLGKPGAA